jgi:Zn-dependent M32 family carboxypeptidase
MNKKYVRLFEKIEEQTEIIENQKQLIRALENKTEQQAQIINSFEKELMYKTNKNHKLQEKIKNLNCDLAHYKQLVQDLIELDKILNV